MIDTGESTDEADTGAGEATDVDAAAAVDTGERKVAVRRMLSIASGPLLVYYSAMTGNVIVIR